MNSLERQIRNWSGCWARRFYFLLHPEKGFRWSFKIPSPLVLPPLSASQVWTSCLVHGRCVSHAAVDLPVAYDILQQSSHPKISCLMITRKRFSLAQKSIECFRRQSYPSKELIIIDYDSDDRLKQWTDSLSDASIVHIRLPNKNYSLGHLRNVSLDHASGEYIAQWDDDDLSHPDRLSLQMGVIRALEVEVCFLHRQLLWSPERHRLDISGYCMAEGTMVCEKRLVPDYAPMKKGEDTVVCNAIVRTARTALCDRPDAYIYVFHGQNTWGVGHYKKIIRQHSYRYCGDQYAVKLRDLSAEYGIDLATKAETKAMHEDTSKPLPVVKRPDAYPDLLILTPVKNAMSHIPRFFQNLAGTDYPEKKISIGLLESDSDDGSYDLLKELLPELRKKYARVELHKQDFAYRMRGQRWAVGQQFRRRSILAQSRNVLLSRTLRDEAWVLWVDADLLSWHEDTFLHLLQSGKDIVVPHCVGENGDTFDLNTFKLREDADTLDWERYLIDGILQPPVGYGRYYLKHFPDTDYVELDGVGGTMLLVNADIHRKGLIFPPHPYRHYIETEGLGQMAQDMGHVCWGMPQVEIVHGDY